MPITKQNTGLSQVQAGSYNQLLSVYDIVRKPQVFAELVQRYGNGFHITNWLHMAGKTMDVKGTSLTVFEEGAPERLVGLKLTQGGGAGTVISVDANTADSSNLILREGFDIIVPQSITGGNLPSPARLTKNGTDWQAYFYDATVAVANPNANYVDMMLGASSHAFGSDGVRGMADGYFQKEYHMNTIKDAIQVEGGQIFQQDWDPIELSNGSILYQAMIKADFRVDSQLDSALFVSERNSNTNMTQETKWSNDVQISGADGLIPTMKRDSIQLEYANDFDIGEFQTVKTALEGVGVVNQDVEFLVGPSLCNNIHDNMQDYLNANSAGHSLYSATQNGYDAMKKVGFGVDVVETYGIRFNVFELHGLANPNKFGSQNYPYREMGFMFPDAEFNVKLSGQGGPDEMVKLPHMTLGYANNKGENRGRRVWKQVRGMASSGNGPIAQTWDVDEYHTLISYMPIFTQMEKTILVTKQ